MLYKLKIKTTKPWLGDIRRGKDTHRRFQRGKKENILAFDLPKLQWSFREACLALHLKDVDIKTIRLEEGFTSPSLVSYRRRYTHQNKKRKQEDFFEAIREGTVLTMDILVTDVAPNSNNQLHPPTTKELKQMFKFLGKMIGLSPWGGHFGYGRFEVLELNEV